MLQLTQSSEHDWPTAKFLSGPDGRNGELVLGVGRQILQRNRLTIPGDHSNNPVTLNLHSNLSKPFYCMQHI